MNNAPRDFLSLYMPKFAANAIDTLTNTQAGASAFVGVMRILPFRSLKRYASFLAVGKSSGQLDVFRDLMLQYEDSSLKITALTLNMENMGAGPSMTGFEGQIEEILIVKKRYYNRLNVFFGLDPRWKVSGDEIKQTLEKYFTNKIHISSIVADVFPFCGIKLYPSTGYYIFDPKMKASLEWVAENKIPILTHCSYLGGIFNNDRNFLEANIGQFNPYNNSKHPAPRPGHKLKNKFFKKIFNTQKSENNKFYSSYFLEPESYRSILNYFKSIGRPLKICFAHFGGSEHMKLQHEIETKNIKDPGGYFGTKPDLNWCKQIQDLMRDFDTVYTDISYSLTDSSTHNFIFNEILLKPYRDRILFGTDFFMTEREAKEKNTYSSFKKIAQSFMITTGDGQQSNAWDMMASKNIEAFLKSSFY